MKREILLITLLIAAVKAGAVPTNPIQQATHECVSYTETVYGTPKELLLAVHDVEAGKPGIISKPNNNKTYDVGPMQHNSATINSAITKYGFTEDHMRNSECASFYVAGWTLRNGADKFHDWKLAIAAYNCGEGCVDNALKKLNGVYRDVSQLDIPVKTKTQYVPNVMSAWCKHAGVPETCWKTAHE